MNSQLLLLANKIDLNVLHFVPSITNTFGINLALFISYLGSLQSLGLLIIALSLYFWLHKKPYHLIQAVVTIGSGLLIVYLIKIYVAKVRPVEALINVGGYSFPSGHATISTIFCSLIIFSFKDYIKNIYLKVSFIFFFALMALVVSFSRVYLSVHYLSDVVVGILLGLLISAISVFVFENFYKKENLL